MGNFSTDPLQELRRSRDRGYVGVRIEQGVPLLDRDLNLLGDLVASTVREVLAAHLGSGLAERDEAFAVAALPADDDFLVRAPPGGGACLVGGIQARIDRPLRYGEQPDAPPLTTPRDGDRDDLVYLDVWIEEEDAAGDPALANAADVAMQTSVRLRPAWRVRVAEGVTRIDAAPPGHAHCPLARLERTRGESTIAASAIVDLRQTGLNLGELARRVQQLEDLLLPFALGGDADAAAAAGGRAPDAARRLRVLPEPAAAGGAGSSAARGRRAT